MNKNQVFIFKRDDMSTMSCKILTTSTTAQGWKLLRGTQKNGNITLKINSYMAAAINNAKWKCLEDFTVVNEGN